MEGVRYDVADVISWLPSLGFDEDTTKTIQKLFRRNAVDGTKLAYLPAPPPPRLTPEPSKNWGETQKVMKAYVRFPTRGR